MWWVPACAFLAGLGLFLALPPLVTMNYANYLSVALIAGLDTILGGWRAGLEERFDDYVFITGFFTNMAAATLIVWLGDRVGLTEMYLAAVVALGVRMFTNLGIVRRLLVARMRVFREPS